MSDDGFDTLSISSQWADCPSPVAEASSLGKRDLDNSPSIASADEPAQKLLRLAVEPAPLPPKIIAHSTLHQKMFEAKKLAFGVQWEIARLVTNQTRATSTSSPFCFDDILIDMLDDLRGTNAERAHQAVPHLLQRLGQAPDETLLRKAFAKEMAARSPWKELDLEEANLAHNPLAGLGGGTPDDPNWYGGKVIFRGHLVENEKNPKGSRNSAKNYRIILDSPELGPSSTIARRFGSTHLLRIKVSESGDNLIEYFSHPFILLGHVYRAFYFKDKTVFMARTNEVFEKDKVIEPCCNASPHGPMPILDFMEWFNPMSQNQKQPMAKYVSRFQLGLSNSVPGCSLPESNILEIPDIVSPNHSDMTDGCGYVSRNILIVLRTRFQWDEFPTAIQVRVCGSKGLLLMHPDENEDQPKVWLRPSLIKTRYSSPLDPAMTVIDVLRSSHLRSPSRFSMETIICLAENGVPSELFVDLLRDALEQVVTNLTTWEGKDSMYRLWYYAARYGSVMSARLAREASGEARVRGFGERDENTEVEENDDDNENEDDNLALLTQRSTAWWTDEISGCPSSLEETVMVLLDAGFTPRTCAVLREKLKQFTKKCVKSRLRCFKIDLPMSCLAWIVPDPFGVLGPDEVQIKSSRRNLMTEGGYETDSIQGDVLLTRTPCKLPTDVRRFKAVTKPQLYRYLDVIVCSIQGMRRPADLLAGGDYDGDKVFAYWDPRVVKSFVDADLKYSYEPEGLQLNFSKVNEGVSSFLERTCYEPIDQRIRETQKCSLSALRDTTLVGKYSNFHTNAVYQYGYSHPKTIELAYMFCKILDGAKTGLTVRPEVLQKHEKELNKRPPAWKEFADERKNRTRHTGNAATLKRHPKLGPFVMDTLYDYSRNGATPIQQRIEKCFGIIPKAGCDVADPDLIAPWQEAQDQACQEMETEGIDRRIRDLAKIAAHVESTYRMWQDRAKRKGSGSFTDLPIETRQDTLRILSRKFASISSSPDILYSRAEIARLAASYAYLYDCQRATASLKWSRFPWDVALRELCHIKAQALGSWRTVAGGFYDRFQLKSSFLN